MKPKAVQLWPHQLAAIQAARDAIDGGQASGLWVMPTGTGKTVTFTTLAKELAWPTLVMVHRDELIRQTCNTVKRVWPEAMVGIIQAERDEWEGLFGRAPEIVIASVASLHARRREQIPRDRFGLIVADEAHHSVAASWSNVIEYFQSRFVLGCTATPDRSDGKGLADLFGREPLYVYSLRQAIRDGRLVDLRQWAIPTHIDLASVKMRHGDFATDELSVLVNTPERNARIAEAYLQHARGRRAIAFAVDVAHAFDLRQALSAAGVQAATVTGDTPTDLRRELLARFAAGEIEVLANCAVLTEGFDDPGISCVLMCRPTASRALYTQCVGRGLRIADGKQDCLVLDFVDNSVRHKLMTATSLLGATRTQSADGERVGHVVEREIAEDEHERGERRYRPLTWERQEVCPWPELPNLIGYIPEQPWHHRPATEKQIASLTERFGLFVHRDLTRGEAAHLMDQCLALEAEYPPPATGKQRGYLKWLGHWKEGLTKQQASELIGRIKSGSRLDGTTRATPGVAPTSPRLPKQLPPLPPKIVQSDQECPF